MSTTYVSLEPDSPHHLVGYVDTPETRRLPRVTTRPAQGQVSVLESEVR